jgi:DNA-binding beta-propeller fold protein YncE
VPGGPLSVIVPAAGGVAYVGTRAGAIVAVGLGNHQVLGTLLQLSGSATGAMDYDAMTSEIYVPDAAAGLVDVLAPAAAGGAGQAPNLPREPARTLPFAGGPAAVAITFDGAYGFVAEHDAGRVAMFDVAEHKTLATLDVGGAPGAIVTGSYPPLLSAQSADIAGIISYVVLGAIVVAAVAYYIISGRRRPADTRATKG